MQFDAGVWGMVEVDEIRQEKGRFLGIKNAGAPYTREIFCSYGREGCIRIRSVSSEEAEMENA